MNTGWSSCTILHCTKGTCGHGRRCQRAVRVVAGRRGPSLTRTFALSNRRDVALFTMIQGGMNGERFYHFLEQVPLLLDRTHAFYLTCSSTRGCARPCWGQNHSAKFTTSSHCWEPFAYLEGCSQEGVGECPRRASSPVSWGVHGNVGADRRASCQRHHLIDIKVRTSSGRCNVTSWIAWGRMTLSSKDFFS